MKWIKKGLIYNTTGEIEWSRSHAQVPKAEIYDNDTVRVYFGTRDSQQRTRPSFVDLSINDFKIKKINDKPLLELGRPGTFDDSGVMPSCLVNYNGKKFLYYTGWNSDKTVPYRLAIGIAVSYDKGNSFEKISEGPILERSVNEPISVCQPYVMIINSKWLMWYSSFTKWELINGKLEPFYNIKLAESKDGIKWDVQNKISIDYDESSDALGNPFVINEEGKFKMFFSFRRNVDYRHNKLYSYRIGYAESYDGISWERKDSEGHLNISDTGWDSEMIAYPNILIMNNKRYMFYNGNGFGKTGFGYAVSDIE